MSSDTSRNSAVLMYWPESQIGDEGFKVGNFHVSARI